MQTKGKQGKSQVVVQALRPFGTTIFTEMTNRANALGAVNLSQGFPDFDGPEDVRAKAAEFIVRGPNQYAPSAGIPELREAVARKMRRFYGVEVDVNEEITVTSGATEGLCATMLGILEPGDEIILIEPCYDSYAPVAAMARAQVRPVSLQVPEFTIPREELAQAFSPKTRAVLINNPHNPSGRAFTRAELSFIGSLCEEHNAYLIGDEVYEHLVYEGHEHVTLMSIPELRDRSFVVSSTAKTFSMTGWKIGYVIAAPELSKAVRMSHQFITFCGQSALQEAMAFAIDFPDTYYARFLSAYARKRNLLCDALQELGFRVYPPEGSYYVLANVIPLGFDDDLSFCSALIEEAGVAAIPCSYFWLDHNQGHDLVRFCFCKKDETLDEAIARLRRWLR